MSYSPTTASESSSSFIVDDSTPKHNKRKDRYFHEKEEEINKRKNSDTKRYLEKDQQEPYHRRESNRRRRNDRENSDEEYNPEYQRRSVAKRSESAESSPTSNSDSVTPVTKKKNVSPTSIESLKSQFSRIQNMKQDLTQITETLSKSRAAISLNNSNVDPLFDLNLLPSTPKLDLTMSGTLGRDIIKKIDSARLEGSKRNLAATSLAFQQPIEPIDRKIGNKDYNLDQEENNQKDISYQSESNETNSSIDLKFDEIDSPRRKKRYDNRDRRSSLPSRNNDKDLVFDDLGSQEKTRKRRHSVHSPAELEIHETRLSQSPLNLIASQSPQNRSSITPGSIFQNNSLQRSSEKSPKLQAEDETENAFERTDTLSGRRDSAYYLSRKIQLLEESTNRYKKREESIANAYNNEVELSNQLQMQLDKIEKEKISLERALRMANESEKTLTNTLKITKENNENLLKVTSEYESQIQQQQKQIVNLEDTISQLKKYKSLYNSLLEAHNDEKTQFTKQNDLLQDKIHILEKKLQESSEAIAEYDQESSEKTKKYSKLHKRYIEIESLLSQSESKIKTLEQETDHLNNIISKKEEHETKMEAQIQEIQNHSKSLQIENDELRVEVQELKISLKKSNQTIVTLEEKVQNLSSFESKSSLLETQIHSLQQELNSTKDSLSESSKELQMAQKQIKVLNTVKSQLEKAIEHKVETFKKQETEIERQMENMKLNLEKYETQSKDLEHQLEDLSIQNKNLNKEKHAIQLESRKQLSDKEKILQEKIEEFEVQFRNAKREWSSECDSLKQKIEQCQETIAKREGEYQEATSERRKFQEKYHALLQEKQELADRATEIESENYSLNLEINRLRKHLEEMKKSIADKSNEVNMFADDFDQVKNKYHLFLSKYDTLLKMHEESKVINRKLESDLKHCQNKMQAYREQRNLLRHQIEVLEESEFHAPGDKSTKKKKYKSILATESTKAKSHQKLKKSQTKNEIRSSATFTPGLIDRIPDEEIYETDYREEIQHSTSKSKDAPKSTKSSSKTRILKGSNPLKYSTNFNELSQPQLASSKKSDHSLGHPSRSHVNQVEESRKSPKRQHSKHHEHKRNTLELDLLESPRNRQVSIRKRYNYEDDSDVSDKILVEQMNDYIHSIEDDVKGQHSRRSRNDSLLPNDQVIALESLLEK